MADGKAVHRAKGSSEHSARLDGRRSLVNTGAPLSGGYFTTSDSRTGGRPLDVLMERRMRWKSHVRCGGRRRGDHRPKGRHRRLAVDPTGALAEPLQSIGSKQERPLGWDGATSRSRSGHRWAGVDWAGWGALPCVSRAAARSDLGEAEQRRDRALRLVA